LVPGKSGCGFAVGVQILATDQPPAAGASVWTTDNQHAASLEAHYHPDIVDMKAFGQNVRFRRLDCVNLALLWEKTYGLGQA
jgi:hypothetical protein